MKKDASKQKQKKVTTNDKAVQTVSEEKITIEAEDLTCTSTFKIIFFFFLYTYL